MGEGTLPNRDQSREATISGAELDRGSDPRAEARARRAGLQDG